MSRHFDSGTVRAIAEGLGEAAIVCNADQMALRTRLEIASQALLYVERYRIAFEKRWRIAGQLGQYRVEARMGALTDWYDTPDEALDMAIKATRVR